MVRAILVGLTGCLCFAVSDSSSARETLDLSGQWQVRWDADDRGLQEHWEAAPLSETTAIQLPGTTDLAGLGSVLNERDMRYAVPYPETTRFPGVADSARVDEHGYLVRSYLLVGPAWYERSIEIPSCWQNGPVELRLERALWRTDVWVDGTGCGSCDSLVSEHRYNLGVLTPGVHRLTVRVDNRMIHNISTVTHAYGPETQSRWNGLVGRIELQHTRPVSISHVATYPAADRLGVRVAIELQNSTSAVQSVELQLRLCSADGSVALARAAAPTEAPPGTSTQSVHLSLDSPAEAWDEFHPIRYRVDVNCTAPTGPDEESVKFGFRQVATVGKEIQINGRRVFLRGTLDCCNYPNTGHPPMSLAEWKSVLGTVKQYGFNHLRFHTWCPPEAAFEAADQLGLYLLAETPAWIDDWGVTTVTRPRGIGHDEEVVEYLRGEMQRISRAYGNHPSFVMFTIGNEFGETQTDWDCVTQLVTEMKQLDPRRLYSGCTARRCLEIDDYWITHRCGDVPSRGLGPSHTDWDFTGAVTASPKPLIAHETGQRAVFPDYDRLLSRFRGPLLPLNLQRHRQSLSANNLLDQLPTFVRASAQFQQLQYKAEHEAMQRTGGLSGYQLLMLTDFTGQSEALVGILDPFGGPKGIVSIDDVRSWNAPTTLLARFPQYVWSHRDTFRAVVSAAHYGDVALSGVLQWSIMTSDGHTLATGQHDVATLSPGGVVPLTEISAPLDSLTAATALTLQIQLGVLTNRWNFWSMPVAEPARDPKGVTVTRSLDAATIDALIGGAKVLWLAHGTENPYAATTGFPSVYWSAGWWGNPFSSLGICCDPAHPALTHFPTSGHSDWQWQQLCDNAATLDLTGAPPGFRPIVQPVPDFHYNHLLAHVFEARVGRGMLLGCGYDLTNHLERRPAARQFRESLMQYLASPSFVPQQSLPPDWLDQRFGSQTLKPVVDGYRGIWFTLGQYSDSAAARRSPGKYWDYGDKYSGGLGTYTAKHVPIAIYAPEVKKTFFCYGGSKDGKRYLYNMVSYYDHEKDCVPRPTIVHDKQGVNDPHDNSALAIDQAGYLWVYVAGRARSRPGFVYRSVAPYDIRRFQLISSDEICYPQPHAVAGQGILELFTKYTGVRELYWNVRHPDGTRGTDRKLAGMEGQYQTSYQDQGRVITAFNRHPGGTPDTRTDLYYLETRDMGQSWQTVDGTPVTPPLVDPVNPALVKAYSRDRRMVYLNSITLDAGGNPIILVVTSADHRAGPQGDPRSWEVLHYKNNQWHISRVSDSTHNYDTGPLWVEPDGSWRILGPTERGPQQWGCGGELALWHSGDEGASWTRLRNVTHNSPRNHTYVRPVLHAPPNSPFAVIWADGNPDKESISRLYFANAEGTVVRRLPYDMDADFATPETLRQDP